MFSLEFMFLLEKKPQKKGKVEDSEMYIYPFCKLIWHYIVSVDLQALGFLSQLNIAHSRQVSKYNIEK